MLDEIPVRVWLLIVIASIAFAPSRYVFDSFHGLRAASGIAQQAKTIDPQKPGLLTRNLLVLASLAALAAFIYTPEATQFAQSPNFWPLLMAACGAWALFTVFKGIISGEIQPSSRGFNQIYLRSEQPKRFWTSMIWNAAFGLGCFWIGFLIIDQSSRNVCYDYQESHSPQDQLAACEKLIHNIHVDDSDLADLLASRGAAYYKLGDYPNAMTDYNAAIRLDPRDSSTLYNRGLIYQQRGDMSRAVADFKAAIRKDPNDAEAHQRVAEIESGDADPPQPASP